MEPLIELVSAFPLLYDPKHQDYLRLSLKERIWEHISRKLDLPSGEVAKAHWRKLRDSHRVALRRQMKKRSDNGECRVRPWQYQKNMEFLLPYMPNYSGLAEFDSEDNGFEETANVSHTFDDYASIENELNSTIPQKSCKKSVDTLEHDDSFDYTCLEDELPPNKHSSKASSKSVRVVSDESIILKTLKNLEERAAARDTLRKTIESNMSTAHRHSDNNDPLYSFFISMYNTTKNFPVRQQLEVRRQVFNLITKIEESVLMGGDVTINSSGQNRQQTVGSEYANNGMVSSLTTML